MRIKSARVLVATALVALLILSRLPASAGLFEWSRLGRLIPQSGSEPSVSVVSGHLANPQTLYAGTLHSTADTNLIFKSTDGGISWIPASGGLPANLPQNTGVNDLVILPNAPNTLFAGLYRAGVWLSTNAGQNWSNATNGSIADNDTVLALAVDPIQNGTVYALTGTGVHRSDNGGPWQSHSAGLPAANATLFNDLAADSRSPGTLYVASSPQGVFRTTNGGQSWQPANSGLPAGDRNVKGIGVNPISGLVLVSVAGQGLWRSDDRGASWTRSDSGITYNTTLQGNVGIPVFSPGDEAVAYVYNNDGVFASTNGGETWTPFNDGFSGAETITTMVFHDAAPDTVYAGTSVAGVWSLTVVPSGRFYTPVIIR